MYIFCNSEVISTSCSAGMLLSWCRADFGIWNAVVISETCKVITTFCFRPPSRIQGTMRYTNMIVLQSVVNEATFEVPYNVLTVTKTQLSLGCVNCR